MPDSTAHQRAHYPLPAYNFQVTIDGRLISFSEISGLEREHETLTYRHGLSFREGEQIAKFRYDKYLSITMRKGTLIGASFLHRWLESKEQSTLDISLCDEIGTPVLSWHIAKATPVKLEAPTFDANTNEVCIESLEVKVAGITIRDRT